MAYGGRIFQSRGIVIHQVIVLIQPDRYTENEASAQPFPNICETAKDELRILLGHDVPQLSFQNGVGRYSPPNVATKFREGQFHVLASYRRLQRSHFSKRVSESGTSATIDCLKSEPQECVLIRVSI